MEYMKDNINKHHVNWNRSWWESHHMSQRIRNHPGMIIPLPIALHNELHHEIPPIRPPHPILAKLALSKLISTPAIEPVYVIPAQADYLWRLAEEDSLTGDEAYVQARHLEDQIEFLNLRNWAA